MSPSLVIILTAGLVATACGLLGPFLILRRVALISDAVSHAVLPGIVIVFIIFSTRAPLYVIVGATLFATMCLLAIELLRSTGLVKADAAIALVFPTLFSIGVLGIQHYAANVHLDLDATIFGEIAFSPFQLLTLGGITLPRSIALLALVSIANFTLVVCLWKELKLTSFNPEFARTVGFSPRLLSYLLMVAVATTAVTAFDSVGAILVVTLFIVPAATAHLLTQRLWLTVLFTLIVGWLSAILGYLFAVNIDTSVAGAMGLVSAALFLLAFVCSPRHGLLRRVRRQPSKRLVKPGEVSLRRLSS